MTHSVIDPTVDHFDFTPGEQVVDLIALLLPAIQKVGEAPDDGTGEEEHFELVLEKPGADFVVRFTVDSHSDPDATGVHVEQTSFAVEGGQDAFVAVEYLILV